MRDASQISARADPAGRAGRRARIQRDAGLERVGSITRKIAVGSIAAAAAFGIYVSRALPGHSARPATSGTTGSTQGVSGGNTGASSSSGGSGGSSAAAGGSSGTLTQPTSPPSQTQQQAPVVSGST